jgi:hypothetical protein
LENIIRKVETVKIKIPSEKIFFLPAISASLPNGNKNIADDNIKLLITQPRLIASAFKSLPIAGSARFTAEPRKGVRKAANVATRSTDFFDVFSSGIAEFIVINLNIIIP